MKELTRAPLTGLVLCLTIVAAFEGRLAAQSTISEDVTVPGGTAAVAAALGIDPVPDRGRFVAELTRLVYDIPPGRNPATDARLDRVKALVGAAPGNAAADSTNELVPIPLSAAVWGQAVFHRPLTAANAFVAILSDREASLVCRGLSALDDETLKFFADHPAVVGRLHARAATAFAGFAANLRIRGGRVAPPGGPDAVPLWEAVVGERVDRPERFVRELFEQKEGRVAYLYDTIAEIDGPQQAFALGLWLEPRARADRFKELIAATIDAYHDWHVRTFPFARPLSDLATLLARVRTDERGRPALASRALWARAFEIGGGTDEADRPADAAWLADVILGRDLQIRGDRLDQYGFGQRVFASARDSDLPNVDEALRAFPRCRMLMLSLERIGVTDPAIYAQAARRAERLSSLDGETGFAALAQFQGSLALVVRLVRVRSVDVPAATALVASLIACELDAEGRYAGAIVRWLDESLRPALPAAPQLEEAILGGLAGRNSGVHEPVAWEGRRYRLDLAAAELRRLRRIREKQGGSSLDQALEIASTARLMTREKITGDDVQSVTGALKTIGGELPPKTKPDPMTQPPGVGAPKNAREAVDRAARDLTKIGTAADASRRAPIAESLAAVADRVAAEALISLAYAIDIGDPDSAVLLAGNVAVRHDFGFALRDTATRVRTTWGLPKTDVAPGVPWRIKGSVLGLDVGLSSVALRRINTERLFGAPALTSNERESFAASLGMMNAFALQDAERDAIGEATRRGRSRVSAITAASFGAAAEAVGMDGWRVRAGHWMLAGPGDRGDLLSLFSAPELMRLGGGAFSAALDEWGMSAITSLGCVCLQLTPPGRWALWTGRPQLGVMAANVADLNLRIAEMLYEMQLPAPIARHVLAAAVQDFIDETRPTDANDWLTLVRTAQGVSRERIEDYVAAAAAVDGPLLPESAVRPRPLQ